MVKCNGIALAVLLACMAQSAAWAATGPAGVATAELPLLPAPAAVTQAGVTSAEAVGTQNVPAGTRVVTAAEIARHGYRTVVEALEAQPGVTVTRQGYMAGQMSVLLNGDKRVLFLLDGRRLNTELAGVLDADTLPAAAFVERIEIMPGPADARYGSAAVGGVVNVVLKRPGERDETWVETGFDTRGGYEYNGAMQARRGSWGALVYGGRRYTEDVKYKTPGSERTGTWNHTSGENHTFGVRLEKDFNASQRLGMHWQHTYKEGKYPRGVDWGSPWGSRLNNNLTLRYDWNREQENAGFVQVYHDYFKARGHFALGAGLPALTRETEETKAGLEAAQQWKLSDAHRLAAGLGWRRATVKSAYFNDAEKDHDLDNTSVYVQDDWAPGAGWTLRTGLRYEHYNSFGSKLLPSLRVEKAINDRQDHAATAYAGYARVFSAPTATGMFLDSAVTAAGTPYHYHGNRDLGAEYGDTYQLGYRANACAATQWGAELFYSKLKDAITWTVTPSAGGFDLDARNAGEEKRRGVMLHVAHRFSPQWQAHASYTYTKVEDALDGLYAQPLRLYPNQYRLGVTYTAGKFTADLTGRYATGGATTSADHYHYADSHYVVADLALRYQCSKDVELFAKAYNLFDAAYAEAPGVDAQGDARSPMSRRLLFVGAKYTF